MSTLRNIGQRPGRTRHVARVAAAIGLAATGLVTACADGPTAPASVPAGAPARALATIQLGTSSPTGTSTTTPTTTTTSSATGAGSTSAVTLTITPTTTATFTINAHRVRIVAGSICDPATSGYGPGLWDAPCTPASKTVTVKATAAVGADGHPVVTFSPDLRFVPGKVNTIWLLDRDAASQQAGVLAWCPTGGTACVDEGATDPSLVTRFTADGFAYRRLKHFSGYTVTANRSAAR